MCYRLDFFSLCYYSESVYTRIYRKGAHSELLWWLEISSNLIIKNQNGYSFT